MAATLRVGHEYVLEIYDEEGNRRSAVPLEPDFGPAAEWSNWQGARSGLPAYSHYPAGSVEPVFHGSQGAARLQGLVVAFDHSPAGAPQPPVIPLSYLDAATTRRLEALVAQGALPAHRRWQLQICAYPLGGLAVPDPAAATATAAAPRPLALPRRSLAALRGRATRLCRGAWDGTDYPVFVGPEVINQALDAAQAAGEVETGGILAGHLFRDTAGHEIHAEITAQVPVTQARASGVALGFTAEAWSAVADALARRGRGETWLGWWHYHPQFCRRCTPPQRARCPLSRPFFSSDDRELHRAVFDAAFSVALLVSDLGEASLHLDWFGWREGGIAPRGVYLLGPAAGAADLGCTAAAAPREEKGEHEQ